MEKVTIQTMQARKARGERITVLTGYDAPAARLISEAGIDAILVGDSLGMVVHGMRSTLPVTMDMMVLHCQAVSRGAAGPLLIGDMPYMSYQISLGEAKRNAARLLAEGGMDAVKLEGGERTAATVAALVGDGIAVQGHIGLTPQSVSAFGGFRVQGKSAEAARALLADARALEDAGAFSIVLEGIPARLAAAITARLRIPTIGIGAGAGCDGQVLVFHDLLGLSERAPKFAQPYADLGMAMRSAFEAWRHDVESGEFPGPSYAYEVDDETWRSIEDALEGDAT